MGTDGVGVRWRFDQMQIQEEGWISSDDGTATFAPDPRNFLDDLAKSKKLVVEAPPYQYGPVEVVFDIDHSGAIVSAAERVCPIT